MKSTMKSAEQASNNGKTKRQLKRKGPSPLVLEPRLMFDGAAVVDALAPADHAAVDKAVAVGADKAIDTPIAAVSAVNSVAKPVAQTTQAAMPADATPVTDTPVEMRVLVQGDTALNGGRREIAFVDSAVQDWETLVKGIHAGIEVVLIDSRGDGLSQIAQFMDHLKNIDAVHIISHGQEADLVLGNLHLNASTISECQTDLARIGAALAPNADLLLYGCSIANNADGLSLIHQLSQATGADVAASTDVTGAASLSGNWVLEAVTGKIEAGKLLSQATQDTYASELALPGVHTGSNSSGIFLGGNYIELGIRTNTSIGKFGADTNPGGSFTGRTNASNAAIAGIGMVGDADGFGTGAVLNVDYFMPGTPEEGFYAGYKVGGVATTGKNFGSTVTNTSSGNTLSATVSGTTGSLGVSQAISFDVNDLFFKNVVTLTNNSASAMDNVRFMRSFDPDNTVDKSGSYSTVNTIERTFAAGDGVAVVSAKSSTGDTYYTRSGSKQAAIVYYSSDNRAKVGMATSGLAPSGVYDANIYDSSSAKGTTGTYDAYISIAVDVGTLAAGASTTFTYYTSLDNRDISTIINSIASADAKSLPTINEDPATNNGATVNSVFASKVAITAVDNTHGQWQYSSNGGTSWNNFGNVVATSARMLDTTYSVRFVPDANWNGGSTMTYRVWNGSGFTAGSTGDASVGGGNFSANTANASITVNAVNDVPYFTKGADQTINEDAGAQTVTGWATSLGKGGGSDEASQTLSFNVSNNNNALFSSQPSIDASGNLTYTAAANASGTATVTVSIHDTGGTANGGVDTSTSQTFTITVNAVNDAPTLTGTAQTLAYTENAAATPIDTAVVVADADSPASFNSGYLQAQITTNGAAEDQLTIINQGNGVGQIGVSGSNVSYGGVVIGTIDGVANGVNGASLKISLNSNASVAATQALARDIAYSNSSDNPSTSSRTVTYTINDGGNTGGAALSATRTATINITAVDDPATLTMSATATNYIENDSNFYVDAGLTLSDPDTTTMNGAKVVIGTGFVSAEDRLSPASGTNADGISYSYDVAKGVLTLSGSANIAQYQAALRAVKYTNLSDAPDVTPRNITITLGNTVSLAIGGINHYYEVITGPLSWTAAKTAAEGRTFQGLTGYLATITSFTENDFIRQKLSADSWIGASDDYTYINAATGTTTYANQAASEGHWYWVTGPEKGTRISDGNGSPVTFSGSYAYWNSGEPNNSGGSEHYGEIYSTGASPGKWNDLPNSSTLSYVVEYSDTGGTPAFSKSIAITPVRVNDAPVASGSVTLTSITEDATTNSGQLVSGFLSASDPDTDPVTGIAISSLVSSSGTWQYSLDNGAIWTNVGSVSNTNALLLRTTDRVRFIPDGLNADTASITYRAWDRTNENATTLKAGQKADVSSNGGTTAYSSGTQTGNLTITAVNDAPVLTPASPTLTGINEDATSNSGQLVSSVLGSSISDVDTGASQGIAITSLVSGNGTWEYSTNGGSSWSAVGSVAGNSALLLRSADRIRFTPNANNGTSASLTYKAWDQTFGAFGAKVDTTVSGGTAAFSTSSDTASITVTSVNDAPVLATTTLALAGITEDASAGPGQTIASILGSNLTDVDAGAIQGVAITGSTVLNAGYWEYSTNGGSSWNALGAVNAGSALLLTPTDRVRYVSDGFQGGNVTLSMRGWDQTSGSAGGTADTSINGTTTAFSAISATATLTVTEVNDAPQVTTAASDASFTEGGSAVSAGLGIVIRDDGGQLSRATVRISSGFTAGDTLAVTVGATGISSSYNAATGVLTLTGTTTTTNYQTVLRSLTFITSSDDPTAIATTRGLQWILTDATNLTGAASASTINVTPTADAPTISSAPTTWSYVEDDGSRIVAPTLSLSDVDDLNLSSATVTVSGTGYLNDGFEVLNAVTTGTGITASFDGSTGVLTLSGTDSVANYQKVLRSVTYTNTRDYNNPSAIPSNDFTLDGSTNSRTFAWQVTDANSDGANGSPTYGAQSSSVSATTVTLFNANEIPQVTNVTGGTSHISYTEGGSPATLEGVLTVHDDGLVSSISSAYVRMTSGLEAGDSLGFYSAIPGWTQTGTATSGTLDNGAGKIISYSWNIASGDLSLNTTAGATDQSDYTAIMQKVGFVSSSDDPTASNATRTLIWRVTDSGGLQSAVTAAQSTIIDITAVNDTAVVSGLPSSGDVIFIENGTSVAIASGLTLSDPDDTKVATASVTLSGTGFINTSEYLALPGSGASYGSNWSVTNFSGTGIDVNYDYATGTLSLAAGSGSVDLATMQSVLRQIQYSSNDDNPTISANTRTLTWVVTDVFGSRLTDVPAGNDGDTGSASSPVTSTITISPRNDAPFLAGFGGTVNYTEAGSAVTLAGSSTLADADDGNLSSATIWISGGFTSGDTLAVISPGSLTTNYDSVTGILTLSGIASKNTYRTALKSVKYSSSSDDPTQVSPTRMISWTITDANAAGDGAMTSAIATSYVNLTATDDAATLSALGSSTFVENGSPAVVSSTAQIADADDTTLSGLTATISAGKTAGDVLTVGADLSGTGITVTSYNSSTGALVLSGTASIADYQAAMRSITFSSTSDDPASISATRTITWSTVSSFASRLTDYPSGNDASAGITTSNAGSNVITVTPLNDAPAIALDDGTVSSTDSPVFQQGDPAIYVIRVSNTAGGITLTDPDSSDQIASASVQISTNGLSSDVLDIVTPAGWVRTVNTFTKGSASILANFVASSSGTLTLTGNASQADYQELLGHVTFDNASLTPTANGASRELTWTIIDTNTAGDGARSATQTSQIVIRNLNHSPSILPTTATNTYTEGAGSVTVPTVTVTDPDPGDVVTATLTLSAPTSGTLSISGGATYNVSTGVWSLSGTVADVNAALAAITFTPSTDNDVDVTIAVNVADSGADGAVAATGTLTLDVTPVNDAPVLTPASPVLTTINEDATSNGGQTVASILGSSVTDVDTGALQGIAINTIVSGNGTWQYSLDSGSTWNSVGAVSNSSSLLLRSTDLVRFLPNSQNATTGNFSYRAWDQSVGSAGSKTSTATNGGGSAFSATADTASITVTGLNDAPVLSAATPALTGINEDAVSNAGQTVASIVGSSVTDVDTGAVQGIAISSLTSGNGTWQYSLDAGTTWNNVGSVSSSSALLLGTADKVRFVPDGNNATSADFSYRAWDTTSGSAGSKVDVSVNGGTTAFSASTDTASINVTAVNDAPVLTSSSPAMTTISEDATSIAGQTVASILGGSVVDVDASALQGIAINDLTSGNGTWQYSTDAGTTWLSVGTVSATNSLLLRSTDKVRFVPDGNNATSGTFSYRAWDQSTGTAGNKVDSSSNGGTAAFSTSTDTATINVTALNDAPVLTAASPVLTTLTEDATTNAGQTVAAILGSSVSDVDSGALQGIAIDALNSGSGAWQYSIDAGATWTNIGTVSSTNALLLDSADLVRFVPNGQNATSASFSYRAWDQSVGTKGTKTDSSVNGGASPFSATTDTASISVTAVNDAPVLTVASPILTTLTEDATNNAGQTVAAILGSSVTDVDSGALQGIAINTLNSGNGTWQYSLDAGSTWINVGVVDATHSLTLRSTDKVRFVPDGNNATAASFGYRAWDQSTGTAGSKVDSSVNGNATAFSATTDAASISVTAVNDAPILAPAAPVLNSLTEDAVSNAGQTVASIIGSSITDVDAGAVQGIALTGTNNGNGHWQYSIDGGNTWNTVGSLATDTGILLRASDKVRFLPDAQNATTASFSFRAWDGSVGTAGTTTSTAVTGGTSAFSLAQDSASITVTPVNDAPINDVIPSLSGGDRADHSLRQDGVITANPGLWHDVDLGDPAITYRYQWEVADDATGTNVHDLTGATNTSYTLTGAEIGKYVRLKVFGSDGKTETVAYGNFNAVTNHDPVSSIALITQETTGSVPIKFTVPANAFTDADPEDTLYYTATKADGSPLPSWITFNPITREFSGTPGGGDIGEIQLRVTASDHGQHTAHADFTMRVLGLPTSLPPPVTPPVEKPAPIATLPPVSNPPSIVVGDFLPGDSANQSSPTATSNNGERAGDRQSGIAIAGVIPASPDRNIAVEAPNGRSISSVASTGVRISKFANSDTSAISANSTDKPTWTAGNGGNSVDSSAVLRSESAGQARGLTREEGFRIFVEPSPTNEIALLLVRPLNDQVGKIASQFRLNVPVDTFSHTQRDAVIQLGATLVDGRPLPSWIHFNASTGEFSGIVPINADGDVKIKVSAHDNFGNEVSTIFRFRIQAGKDKISVTGRNSLSSQLQDQRSNQPKALVRPSTSAAPMKEAVTQ